MVSIDEDLGAIKRDPLQFLDSERILELCRKSGYWPEADGKLDPPTLIALFMQQIAAGNVSCDQVRLMGRDAFTAGAYCQARMRLPLASLQIAFQTRHHGNTVHLEYGLVPRACDRRVGRGTRAEWSR